MSSLSEVAANTRKAVNFCLIGLISLIILKFSFNYFLFVWKKLHPPPPSPPQVAFGKLPKIDFPFLSSEKTASSEKINYLLETIEGGLPKLSKIEKVYFIPKPGPNLLSMEKAKNFASRLDFLEEPLKINESVYQWTDSKNPLRKLSLNIILGNFTLTYDFSSLDLNTNAFSKESAILEAKKFLENMEIKAAGLLEGETKVRLLKKEGGKLSLAKSLAETQAIRVDFFPRPVNNLKIVTSDFESGPFYVIFSFSEERKKILEAGFNFHPPDEFSSSTYPLKNVSTAYEELKKNEGFIAGGQTNNKLADARFLQTNKVIIRKVYLAYYYGGEDIYLQPVFVFEGDNDFVGYVPAVISEWRE